MKKQFKLLKIALITVTAITAQFCMAADEELSHLLRELVPANAQPCQEKKSCYCIHYSNDTKVPLRYSRAEYCPVSGVNANTIIEFTSWDQHNKKVDEGSFFNNAMHGLWTSWHPNGIKAAESSFENGKQTGNFTTWHENGRIAITGQHVNDKPHGTWLYHDKEGKIEKRIKWDHGKLISKRESN